MDRLPNKEGEKTMKYFNCPECKGDVIDGRVKMDYDLNRMKVTVKNVPAKVCSKCGQEFIDGPIAENLDRLVDRVTEDVNSFSRKIPVPQEEMRKIAIAI
jgi:YgiT-type zinc finger domain-containing protein